MVSKPIGLGMEVQAAAPNRRPRRPDRSPHRPLSVFQDPVRHVVDMSAENKVVGTKFEGKPSGAADAHDGHEDGRKLDSADPHPTPPVGIRTSSYSDCGAGESGFSRHDSLFSFGVSSSRNAAELKSLLGNSNSRLKPGATVLSRNTSIMDKDGKKAHAVSLEQAKPRARVEVDIVLESDCCVEGGYLRGHIKLRIRKHQKKEAFVLIADGKIRVIGFECIPVTDSYTGIYDSPPDVEGFSRAIEGVHTLPFAMHLPIDDTFGSAKGALSVHSGVTLRYIAMISVKVKDSKTMKRSIAHFYRDCQVWPRIDPSVVLASAPRPIQASTAKSLSVIGSSSKLKLTAMLHRMTWIAGQRCYVRIWIQNDTKKTVKSVTLTLVRTTTLFKPRPHLSPSDASSLDPDACQTATTHKVVVETVLERSSPAAKGHASSEGWWTGVQADEDAQFSHYLLIPPEALSVSRSRLFEVEYSIRVTASAGALTPDVHVTVPVRIINFLSVDPTPSEPLLSTDGSYSRLVPYEQSPGSDTLSAVCDAAVSIIRTPDPPTKASRPRGDVGTTFIPSLAVPHPLGLAEDPPLAMVEEVPPLCGPKADALNAPNRQASASMASEMGGNEVDEDRSGCGPDINDVIPAITVSSESDRSMYSLDSFRARATPPARRTAIPYRPRRDLANLELGDDVGSDEEVDFVLSFARCAQSSFAKPSDSLQTSKAVRVVDVGDEISDNSIGHGAVEEPRTPSSYREFHNRRSYSDRVPRATGPRERRSQTIRWADRTPPSQRRSAYVSAELDGARERIDEHRPGRTHSAPGSAIDIRRWDPLISIASESDVGDEDGRATSHERRPDTMPSSAAPNSELQRRPSRQLPQPPSRPPTTYDVPKSVSALEALRLSRLRTSHLEASPSPTPTAGVPRSRSKSPAVDLHTGPSHLPSFISSKPSGRDLILIHTTEGRYSSTRTPASKAEVTRRPTETLCTSESSDCSVVKGRIAAFEERLRSSQEKGLVAA